MSKVRPLNALGNIYLVFADGLDPLVSSARCRTLVGFRFPWSDWFAPLRGPTLSAYLLYEQDPIVTLGDARVQS